MLQRVIKHIIKKAALDFFAGWSTRLLRNGSKPEEVSLPHDLPTLRNASITWTLEAYHHLLAHPEIVKKAWEKCQTGDWNLSWEKLTAPETTQLFFDTVATNTAFRNEVSTREPIIPCSAPEFLVDPQDKMEVLEDLTASSKIKKSANRSTTATSSTCKRKRSSKNTSGDKSSDKLTNQGARDPVEGVARRSKRARH